MTHQKKQIIVEASGLDSFPRKAHPTDAAYDLFVATATEITPNSRVFVPLGFKIQLPYNVKLLIQPRSGQSGKGMIAYALPPRWFGGCPLKMRVNADALIGLVDCDYGGIVNTIVKSGRWKWKHRIMRWFGFTFVIREGQRICQGAFTYVPQVQLVEGEVNGTRSGLGSTDK